MARDLILQRARSRRHHDALARLQRRDQIRERLAGTRARFDDQWPRVFKRARDGRGHRALLGTVFVIRNRALEPTAGCEQVDHFFGLAAFSV